MATNWTLRDIATPKASRDIQVATNRPSREMRTNI